MSGSVPRPCNGLAPLWVAESIILPVVLCSHHRLTFNPVCVLCPHCVGPVIKRNWPWDCLVNDGLGEGWVQSLSEQEDRSSEIPSPLHNVLEVVKCCDVSVKIFSLHLDS